MKRSVSARDLGNVVEPCAWYWPCTLSGDIDRLMTSKSSPTGGWFMMGGMNVGAAVVACFDLWDVRVLVELVKKLFGSY